MIFLFNFQGLTPNPESPNDRFDMKDFDSMSRKTTESCLGKTLLGSVGQTTLKIDSIYNYPFKRNSTMKSSYLPAGFTLEKIIFELFSPLLS